MTTSTRALITGITGQDGSYLAELLLAKGLRGPRDHPALLLLQHGAPRPPLPGSARPEAEPRPALRRPERRVVAEPRPEARRAARDLQPRRAEPREGLLRRARVHGRGDGARRHADPRGRARSRPEAALLPGVVVGDVRQGRRDAAERDDAVPSALPLRRREALRARDHGELPRVVRPPRHERDPLQPRVARGAARRSSRARSRARSAGSSAGCRTSSGSGTSTRSATGASRATTSTRCGSCSGRTRRTTS